MGEIIGELSVCIDCLLLHANGEIAPDRPDTEPMPLCKIEPGQSVTLGAIEHTDGCTDADREEGCDCDQHGFRWSSCQGCGSTLGGDRFAMVLWQDVTQVTTA